MFLPGKQSTTLGVYAVDGLVALTGVVTQGIAML